jgi:hypothetical protein
VILGQAHPAHLRHLGRGAGAKGDDLHALAGQPPVDVGFAVELLGPLEPHVQGGSRLGDGPFDLPSGGEHLPGVIEELRPQKGPTQLLLRPSQQLGHTRCRVLTPT